MRIKYVFYVWKLYLLKYFVIFLMSVFDFLFEKKKLLLFIIMFLIYKKNILEGWF